MSKDIIKFVSNLTYKEFVKTLSTKKTIKDLINILKNIPYKTYVIQTPSYSKYENKKFEFVVINSPGLSGMKLDTKTYRKYFSNNKDVTSFQSLDGETILIVPKMLPSVKKSVYKNIASFSRGAPINQQIELWKKVSNELQKCITSGNDCYLNTHGYGIGWLHIRIDKRPKYYIHTLYI